MYEREVVEQEAKVEKMKAEGKDQHDIKKQVRASIAADPSVILSLPAVWQFNIPYSIYYKPMGDLPYISSEQGVGSYTVYIPFLNDPKYHTLSFREYQ